MTRRKAAEAKKGELVGYARVSTEDQSLDMQSDALRKAGCISIYEEKKSGGAAKRPVLDRAIKELRPGDTLVVWRLDRLARSGRELHRRLGAIEDAKAEFKSLQEGFDFTTATGRFVLGILGLVAELERQLTADRTKAGLKARQERGIKLGAKPKLSPADVRRAEQMMRRTGKRKMTMLEIAAELGVSGNTIYQYFPGGRRALAKKPAKKSKRKRLAAR